MTLFPVDDLGHTIAVLAPLQTNKLSLKSAAQTMLSSDDSDTRIVRLYTTSGSTLIGVGTNAQAHMPLSAHLPEVIKLAPGQTLYGQGSGDLYITLLG